MKATSRSATKSRTGPKSEALSIGQRFHQIKMSIRRELADEFHGVIPVALIRRALDEAEQAALESGFPHLFFPELAKEQVRRVSFALHGDLSFADRALAEANAA